MRLLCSGKLEVAIGGGQTPEERGGLGGGGWVTNNIYPIHIIGALEGLLMMTNVVTALDIIYCTFTGLY